MALFGKADKDLPILTQLYQAETDELGRFFADHRDPPMWDVDPDLAAWCYHTARELMDTLVDHQPVRALAVYEITERHRERARRLLVHQPPATPGGIVLGRVFLEAPDPYLRFPLEEISLAPAHTIEFDESPLIFRALEEMREVLEGALKVARCIECKNPFIVRRGEPDYCSHRCRNRERQRNRYREQQAKT